MNYLCVAYAANLNRAADTLERLAAGLAAADSTKQESLEEMQAEVDAGAAIWGVFLRGFITVPEVVGEVQELTNSGIGEPDIITNNGAECANLFFAVMREFVYPLGETIAPNYSLCEPDDPSDDDRLMYRKSELRAESSGCRMMARLIETAPADEIRWSMPARREVWANRFGEVSIRTLENWAKDGSLVWKLYGSNEWRVDVSCPRYVKWNQKRLKI